MAGVEVEDDVNVVLDIIVREAFLRRCRLDWLEPASALSRWLLVGLQDPVLTRRNDSAVVDLVDGEIAMRVASPRGESSESRSPTPAQSRA